MEEMSLSTRMACVSVVATWLLALAMPAVVAEEAAPPPKPTAPALVKPIPPEPVLVTSLTDQRVQEIAKATGLTSDVVRSGAEYILKYKPRLARDLDNALKTDPQQYRGHITDSSYYARSLEQLKKTDPVRGGRREQTLDLEAQTERLSDRYKEVSEGERPQIEVELTNALAKVFELRLEEERYQLEQLKKQVEQMQARLNERVKNKDRIVDRQLTTLLGLAEALAW